MRATSRPSISTEAESELPVSPVCVRQRLNESTTVGRGEATCGQGMTLRLHSGTGGEGGTTINRQQHPSLQG